MKIVRMRWLKRFILSLCALIVRNMQIVMKWRKQPSDERLHLRHKNDDGDWSGGDVVRLFIHGGSGVDTHSTWRSQQRHYCSNKMGKMFYVNFKCSIITMIFMENLVWNQLKYVHIAPFFSSINKKCTSDTIRFATISLSFSLLLFRSIHFVFLLCGWD